MNKIVEPHESSMPYQGALHARPSRTSVRWSCVESAENSRGPGGPGKCPVRGTAYGDTRRSSRMPRRALLIAVRGSAFGQPVRSSLLSSAQSAFTGRSTSLSVAQGPCTTGASSARSSPAAAGHLKP
jgi:hypothetical protein